MWMGKKISNHNFRCYRWVQQSSIVMLVGFTLSGCLDSTLTWENVPSATSSGVPETVSEETVGEASAGSTDSVGTSSEAPVQDSASTSTAETSGQDPGSGGAGDSGTGVVTPSITIAGSAGTEVKVSNQSAFGVTGTCNIDGASIGVADSGGALASTTCVAGGWTASFDLSAQPDSASFSVTATLVAAGGATGSAVLTLMKDTVPPSIASLAVTGGSPTNATSVTVTGTVNDGTHYTLTSTPGCSSGGTWTAGTTINQSWSLTQNAVNTIYVIAKDAVGNVSGCNSVTVVHDDIAPTFPASPTLTYSAVTSTSLSLTAMISASESVSVEAAIKELGGVDAGIKGWTKISGSNASSFSPLSYSFSGLSLRADKKYVVQLRLKDAAGNLSSPIHNGAELQIALSVQALYPNTTSGWASDVIWTHYVRNDSSQTDVRVKPYTATGAICDLTDTNNPVSDRNDCIHAGEKFKVDLPGVSSCSGLGMRDLQMAFEWECHVIGGQATFVTRALQDTKGLRDLVEVVSGVARWRQNKVTLIESGGGATLNATNPLAAWFGNPVVNQSLNASSVQSLSQDWRVFVIAVAGRSHGFNINANHVSLVTLPGFSLSTDQSTMNVNSATAETDLLSNNSVALVAAGTQSFLWIEVETNSTDTHQACYGLFLNQVKMSVVRNSLFQNSNTTGGRDISLSYSELNLLQGNRIGGKGTLTPIGLHLQTSHRNVFMNNRFTRLGALTEGVVCLSSGGSNDNVMVSNHFSNCGTAMYFYSSSNNKVINTIIANSIYGLKMSGGGQNVISHLTAGNLGTEAISILGSSVGNIITQGLFNNLQWGIRVDTSSGTKASQLAFGRVTQYLVIKDASDFTVTENFVSESGLSCLVSDTNDLNCSGVAGGGSRWSMAAGTIKEGVMGPVTSSDSTNGIDTNGVGTPSLSLDIFRFDSWFRGWGYNTSSFIDDAFSNRCSGTDCRIWDWRLKSSSPLLNHSGLLSGSTLAGFTNGTFDSTGASFCPPAVHGDRVITVGSSKVLVNAVEIMRDSVGNDNGLCESDEACIYSPHFGAYQGEGSLTSGTCQFQDGTSGNVQGVDMFAYEIRGGVN